MVRHGNLEGAALQWANAFSSHPDPKVRTEVARLWLLRFRAERTPISTEGPGVFLSMPLSPALHEAVRELRRDGESVTALKTVLREGVDWRDKGMPVGRVYRSPWTSLRSLAAYVFLSADVPVHLPMRVFEQGDWLAASVFYVLAAYMISGERSCFLPYTHARKELREKGFEVDAEGQVTW